jgi:hypothetical protein
MSTILAFYILLAFHPVHVSMTSIELVPGTDSLKVFVRMYYDDFLLDYNLLNQDSSVTVSDNNGGISREMINNYINEKVIITINNKLLVGKLLEQTLTDNEISLNLLYRQQRKPSTITVKNLIMTSLHNDQANMMIIRINKFEEGIKLTPENAELTINLN